MAGNYPDVPQHRIAYDRDGTQGFLCDTGFTEVTNQLTQADLQNMNDSIEAGYFGAFNAGVALIFPVKVDLDAIWVGGPSSRANFQTSVDTTNGIDGTWAAYITPTGSGTRPSQRNNIDQGTALGIRGIRFTGHWESGSDVWVNLYGERSPDSTQDFLLLWDPTTDKRIDPAYFDFGDSARESSVDKTFRVKNVGDDKTAYSIRVAMETLTDATPSWVGQHQLSKDGSTFLAQVNIGDLAPGAISDVLTLRQAVASNAQLSLWWMRVFATADHWA